MMNALERSICTSLVVGAVGWLLACGDTDIPANVAPSEPASGDSGAPAPSGHAEADGSLPAFNGPVAEDAAAFTDDCTDNSKLVYVLTGTALYRFDPPSRTFTLIGRPSCPGDQRVYFFSMSVDRAGNVWALGQTTGKIYEISTTDATCQLTSFMPGQQGISQFGMGFSFDPVTRTDHLYVNEGGTETLARIDPTSLQVTLIGPVTPPPTPYVLELSGTGNGRLFAFDVFGPNGVLDNGGKPAPRILRLDPATAAILEEKPVQGTAPGDFAFAQWGGDFWLFTPASATRQRVTRFSWSTGQTIDTSEHDIEGHVIGAGSSTCAPFVPPPIK